MDNRTGGHEENAVKTGFRLSLLNPFPWPESNWRRFFFWAAMWNFSAAFPAIIWPEFGLKLFYSLSTHDPHIIIFNRCFWMAVAIFGMGYMMVSFNPSRQTGIIFMGVVGKIAVALNWCWMVFSGTASFMAFFGATGDSIFTVYFIVYLLMDDRPQTADVQ